MLLGARIQVNHLYIFVISSPSPFFFQKESVKIMKKGTKTMLHTLLWIAAIIAILILICFGYHRYRLKKEEKLREPLGQLVDIK